MLINVKQVFLTSFERLKVILLACIGLNTNLFQDLYFLRNSTMLSVVSKFSVTYFSSPSISRNDARIIFHCFFLLLEVFG